MLSLSYIGLGLESEFLLKLCSLQRAQHLLFPFNALLPFLLLQVHRAIETHGAA